MTSSLKNEIFTEEGQQGLQDELDVAAVGQLAGAQRDLVGTDLHQVEAQRGQQLMAARDLPQLHANGHLYALRLDVLHAELPYDLSDNTDDVVSHFYV